MGDRVAAFHFQTPLIDEWEKRLIIKQELFNFRTKGRVFLAFEKESKAKAVGFFKADECLGATFRQGKANRWILGELFAFLAPIFHQGDIRRA